MTRFRTTQARFLRITIRSQTAPHRRHTAHPPPAPPPRSPSPPTTAAASSSSPSPVAPSFALPISSLRAAIDPAVATVAEFPSPATPSSSDPSPPPPMPVASYCPPPPHHRPPHHLPPTPTPTPVPLSHLLLSLGSPDPLLW